MQEMERPLYRYMVFVLAAFALAGLAHQGPAAAFKGLLVLLQTPTRLISDFTVIGGIGAALLNASIVGAIALGIVRFAGVRLAGPTVAGVFTMMGFSLFGNTPVNVSSIMLGVYLAGRISGKSFKQYLLISFFGTALGPLADFMAFEAGFTGLAGIAAGAVMGVAAGIILPALAIAMLRLHQGFSLYNIGLTAGFIGLFASSLLVAARHDLALGVIWNSTPDPFLFLAIPILSVITIAYGIALGGKKALTGFMAIMKLNGRLPSDFMELVSNGATLVNMGVLGLLCSAYIFVVGGDFNGPTLGGLMTIMGFASFGKHPRNCSPVMAGVLVATLVFGKSPSAPGPLLALLFGTTLAPLAGEFGVIAGFVAGFLHLVIVERSAAWHGGLNLYNNGFAGGLTAAFIVALIEWYRSNRNNR